MPNLPIDAVDRQVRADLDGARAGPLDLVDHQLVVAVLRQPRRACVAAVGPGDRLQPVGEVLDTPRPSETRTNVSLPRSSNLYLRPQLRLVGERREAGVGPLLPALAQHRALEAVGAVDAPLHGEALGAAARVPGLGGVVAVQVAAAVVVVVLLAAEHHAVAHEGAQPAHVRVVGAQTQVNVLS